MRSLAMAVLAVAVPAMAAPVTFDFQFDNTFLDGSVTPPIVGTGWFTIETDPGDGTFALDQVGPRPLEGPQIDAQPSAIRMHFV